FLSGWKARPTKGPNMRYLVALLSSLVLLTSLPAQEPETPRETVKLFNGMGYLATQKAYRDYRLSLEFKWGKRTDGGKFVRNSGVLLHATGPDGGAGGTWMSSIECQLAQGCVGDLIVIRGKDARGEP